MPGPCNALRVLIAAWLLCAACSLSGQTPVSVTTWGYDNARDLQNTNEIVLTPSNVNSIQFGKLFSQPVDGYVYAQPLYLPSVTIGGQTHNVVYIATEHDGVYAFDANTNGGSNASPLWYDSLFTTAFGAAVGATTVPDNPNSGGTNYLGTDIVPEVGITGTPVIDSSTGTLYVVSKTLENNTFVQRLHALDVTSGAEKFGGPVVIAATVPGTGNGSVGGTLTFDSEWENQRPGLILQNGIVYIGFAAHGDNGPWHGWILGYNAQTLKQTGAFCTSPNGVGSGIWMSGAGLAAEINDPVNHPYGRMLVVTGNGDYTATTPYGAGMDFGDSILNLDLTNGVPTIQDEFTPINQDQEDAEDGDQGSAGLLIVPTQTTGNYPHLLVQTGKSGCVYLINRDNLGGYVPPPAPLPTAPPTCTGDQVVQELPYTVGNVGTWSMPAYWNGTVYYWGVNDNLKAFPLVNGILGVPGQFGIIGPSATSSESYGFPGANPSISANGSLNGIVWTIDSEQYNGTPTPGPALLQAHIAAPVGSAITTLYSSSTNLARDNPGPAVKFTVPTVANGQVFVGAEYQVSFYGLLDSEPVAATPSFTPSGETFSGSVPVSITDLTPNATIYFTLDGTTPTVHSPVYTPGSQINVTASTTIQAIASASGYIQSAVGSAAYVLSAEAATPTFSLAAGTYTEPFSLTISDTTSGAVIYYTTDGSDPATSSTALQYIQAFTVSETETVNAIAEAPSYSNSAVATAAYTLNIGATGIDFPVGFAGTAGIVILNGSAGLDDSRLQMTNGSLNEAGSAWYYQPVSVQAFNTSFNFQLSNPAGNGITFAIQGNNTAALGADSSGLGYQGIGNSIAVKFDFTTAVGLGTDSTGLYTNGAAPTTPAIDLSTTGINLQSDDTMEISLTYNGAILSMSITDLVTGAEYSTSWPINIPSIVGGNTAYVGFTGGTGTGSSSQKILTWNYTVGSSSLPFATTPTFNPPGGSYTSAQTVSISSLTSGATIYYTTNGSTPTTSSTKYTGPITVSSNETLEVIAVETNYTTSAVGTATYSISGSIASLTSPTGGSTFKSNKVTFTWTAGMNVSMYDLYLGTTLGSNNLYQTGHITALSTTATIPTNGATVYARLLSYINGAWKYSDYTFTEGSMAVLTSPVQGSTLTGATVTFKWTAGVNVTAYDLYVGSGVGLNNIYQTGHITATSTVATHIPTTGATIYVRLFSMINGAWQTLDYTFTEATLIGTPAALTSPTNGATLGSSNVTFNWTPGSNVTQYDLYLGTTVGSNNLYQSGHITAKSTTVPKLPTTGAKVYARLMSYINGAWQWIDYTFTEATLIGTPAVLTSPTNGSTLGSSNVTFTWTPGSNVTEYDLYLGTTANSNNLYQTGHITTTTTTVPKLPTAGATVYATLLSLINGAWQYNDYVFTEQTSIGQTSVTVDASVAPCTFHTPSYVTSSTCTLSNVPAGDMLLCSIGYGDLGYSARFTDSVNSGNYLLGQVNWGGSNAYHQVLAWFAYPNSGAGSPVITATYSQATNSAGGGCFAAKNARTTGWIDASSVGANYSSSPTTTASLSSPLVPSSNGELLYGNLSGPISPFTISAGTNFTQIASQPLDGNYSSYWAQTTAAQSTCPFTVSPADNWMMFCAGILPSSASAGADPYQGLIVNFSGLGTSAPTPLNLCTGTSGGFNGYMGALSDCGDVDDITYWSVNNTNSDLTGSTSGPTATFSTTLYGPGLIPVNYVGNSPYNLQRTTGTSGDFVGAGIFPVASQVTYGAYVETDIAQNDTSGDNYYLIGIFNFAAEYLDLELIANGSTLTAVMAGQGYSDVPLGTFNTNTTYWMTSQFNEGGTEYMSLYTGCPSSCTLAYSASHADGRSGVGAQSIYMAGSPNPATETSGNHIWIRNLKTCPSNLYPCLP